MKGVADISITVNDNGPYKVAGSVQLLDGAGRVMEVKEQFYLCRCGHSQKKPFCDGSHKKFEFASAVRAGQE